MNLRLVAVVLSVGYGCNAVDLTQYVHPLVGTEGAIPGVSTGALFVALYTHI